MDLFHPVDKGRSFHNKAAFFYKELFKLPPSPNSVKLVPSVDDIYQFIKMINKSKIRSHQLVVDLQYTPHVNIWPELPSPPAN